MKIQWLKKAKDERIKIIEYLSKFNTNAAYEFDENIKKEIDDLKKFPYKGRKGRVPLTRELVIKYNLEFPPSVLSTWLQRPFCQLKRRIVAK